MGTVLLSGHSWQYFCGIHVTNRYWNYIALTKIKKYMVTGHMVQPESVISTESQFSFEKKESDVILQTAGVGEAEVQCVCVFIF